MVERRQQAMELEGRKALVTGGGSGLGRAAAIRLAEAGADVAVLSRSADEIDATARRIEALGRSAIRLTADVSDPAAMAAAFDRIARDFGRLDIVFANAGINGVWAPLRDLRHAEWMETMAINLGGTFLTLHHAIPLMEAAGGSIVVTASINGTRTFTTAGASAYATTKAGQVALAQMAALELARHRIRVNVICPGAIESEIDDNTDRRNTAAADVPAHYPDGEIPLTGGAPGTADEVADLVVFLASDRARHITGTPVYVDGGQSLLV
jgi:NAD(P)-dependent dehydrogenase (short-subunit alcohol dehydrogenase family)